MPPTSATVQVWIDWGTDGFAVAGADPDAPLARGLPEGSTSVSDNITNDVERLDWHRGGQFDLLGGQQPGGATITVKNTTGKYSPDNTASVLYGLLKPGRPVWIGAVDQAAATYGLFGGFLREVVPLPRVKYAQLICVDAFAVYAEAPARVSFSESRSVQDFRCAILTSMGEAARANLTAEPDPCLVSGADVSNALALLEALNSATGTRHWIEPGVTKENWYSYETMDRNTSLGNTTPTYSLAGTEFQAMAGYRLTNDTLINRQRITPHPREFPATVKAISEVWRSPLVPFTLRANETHTVYAELGGWVKSATASASNSIIDGQMGVVVDGLLVAGTIPITATTTSYGRSARIDLVATSDATVTGLVVTGLAAIEPSTAIMVAEDTNSANVYGVIREAPPVDAEYIGSLAQAQGLADHIVFRSAAPRTRPTIQTINDVGKTLTNGMHDVIGLSLTDLSISNRRYEIVGINGNIERDPTDTASKLWTFDWTLLETPYQTNVGLFVLDTSATNGTDILGI